MNGTILLFSARLLSGLDNPCAFFPGRFSQNRAIQTVHLTIDFLSFLSNRWGNVFTGVDISPNGRDIVLLSYGGLDYRCRDADESIEDALGRFGLHLPAYKEEPNGGESIAFSSDMTGLYSCQESGGWTEVPLYHYPATLAGLLEGRSSAALNTRASAEESNTLSLPTTTTPSFSPSSSVPRAFGGPDNRRSR